MAGGELGWHSAVMFCLCAAILNADGRTSGTYIHWLTLRVPLELTGARSCQPTTALSTIHYIVFVTQPHQSYSSHDTDALNDSKRPTSCTNVIAHPSRSLSTRPQPRCRPPFV